MYLSDQSSVYDTPASDIRGVAMHVIVRPDVKQKLIEMAAKESRTLSAMTALVLMKALSSELGPA